MGRSGVAARRAGAERPTGQRIGGVVVERPANRSAKRIRRPGSGAVGARAGAGLSVLGLGAATRIYLAAGATDMRKGFEGLYGLVRDHLQLEPLRGHIFLFSNAQWNRLKLLFWDGSGLWVCAKRLERGRYCWLRVEAGQSKVVLSQEDLALLLG